MYHNYYSKLNLGAQGVVGVSLTPLKLNYHYHLRLQQLPDTLLHIYSRSRIVPPNNASGEEIRVVHSRRAKRETSYVVKGRNNNNAR